MEYRCVLNFWFEEIKPGARWRKDESFDRQVAQRFGNLHRSAVRGELFPWRTEAIGRLAEIIVLDQFSRNIYRYHPEAFAQDVTALVLAQEAVASGAHGDLTPVQKSFLYMPYMHSESLAIHRVAIELFSQEGLEDSLRFELRHKEILERFGRYPHRNEILGRPSTAEEIEFLSRPASGF